MYPDKNIKDSKDDPEQRMFHLLFNNTVKENDVVASIHH